MSKIIDAINQENLKASVPEFNVGDTVRVNYKVVEGTRERIQAFEGVVIAKKGGKVHVIGDAASVGNLRTVIWGAWDVCMKL